MNSIKADYNQIMSTKSTGEPGRLKIFLGYAPTVGKSHAMLDAAVRKKAEGLDVEIGCLDLFLNSDLLPLVHKLQDPILEMPSSDLDLDQILNHRPDLVVIDDLSHTNPPGYRHPRRYQDVEELLAAGIDVFTTLDVQELESLRDLITPIVGGSSLETIPDKIFQNASVIEFIDLPPEEIIQRLNHKINSGELSREQNEPYLSSGTLIPPAGNCIEKSYGHHRKLPSSHPGWISGKQGYCPGKREYPGLHQFPSSV